jgi:hypothetical protein
MFHIGVFALTLDKERRREIWETGLPARAALTIDSAFWFQGYAVEPGHKDWPITRKGISYENKCTAPF